MKAQIRDSQRRSRAAGDDGDLRGSGDASTAAIMLLDSDPRTARRLQISRFAVGRLKKAGPPRHMQLAQRRMQPHLEATPRFVVDSFAQAANAVTCYGNPTQTRIPSAPYRRPRNRHGANWCGDTLSTLPPLTSGNCPLASSKKTYDWSGNKVRQNGIYTNTVDALKSRATRTPDQHVVAPACAGHARRGMRTDVTGDYSTTRPGPTTSPEAVRLWHMAGVAAVQCRDHEPASLPVDARTGGRRTSPTSTPTGRPGPVVAQRDFGAPLDGFMDGATRAPTVLAGRAPSGTTRRGRSRVWGFNLPTRRPTLPWRAAPAAISPM